jgi:hypothetical protein
LAAKGLIYYKEIEKIKEIEKLDQIMEFIIRAESLEEVKKILRQK